MRGETAIAIIARHKLSSTDRRPPRHARLTLSAGDYCWNDYRTSNPVFTIAGRNHASADLMPEHQRKRVSRRYTFISETNIRVADSATRHLQDYLVLGRLQRSQFAQLNWLAYIGQLKSVNIMDLHIRLNSCWPTADRKSVV